VFQSTICFSQKEGNIWCFGDSAGIDWNDAQNPILFKTARVSRGSCTSIADSLGSLLFYKGTTLYIGDTCPNVEFGRVFSKDNSIMEGGNCISGSGYYNEHVIVPFPGNDSLFYIFSRDDDNGINYSVVNIKENSGLGKLIETDILIAISSPAGFSWFIRAIKHGNGRDWWIIAKTTFVNVEYAPDLYYFLFLITPNGIEEQQIPINEPDCGTSFSTCGFSKDGTKFYSMCPNYPFGNIVLYDFDRCTGELTNKKIIDETPIIPEDSVNDELFCSAEFSPNNKFLYVNTQHVFCNNEGVNFHLFQYNLEEDFPSLTRDTILVYEENNSNFFKDTGTLRLAPDDKIYFSRSLSSCSDYWWPYPDSLYHPWNMNLSVINSPDSAYPACSFTPYSFYLGGARTYYGLPNNPNFSLGAMEGTPCDTLSTSVREIKSYKNNQLNIFPNPCYNNCQIQYKPALSIGNIAISNMEGKVIFKEENIPVTLLQHGYEVNTSAFAKGVYFVSLVTDKESVTKKMVKL
jgi:Secretion system C-terminal sorting domain